MNLIWVFDSGKGPAQGQAKPIRGVGRNFAYVEEKHHMASHPGFVEASRKKVGVAELRHPWSWGPGARPPNPFLGGSCKNKIFGIRDPLDAR